MTKKRKIVLASGLTVILAVGIIFTNIIFSQKKYEVTFYSDDNTIIKVDEVPRNDSANPPVSPQVPYGKVFKKWDTDFSKVKKELSVRAVYDEFTGKPNVLALSGAYGVKDGFVYIPFQLCGNVCLSGFDVSIKYDTKVLKLESVYNEDGGIVYNSEKLGQININYVSTVNTLGDVDICYFKFKIVSNEIKETKIDLTVNKVCEFQSDDKIVDSKYTTINSSVFVIK